MPEDSFHARRRGRPVRACAVFGTAPDSAPGGFQASTPAARRSPGAAEGCDDALRAIVVVVRRSLRPVRRRRRPTGRSRHPSLHHCPRSRQPERGRSISRSTRRSAPPSPRLGAGHPNPGTWLGRPVPVPHPSTRSGRDRPPLLRLL